MDCIAETLSMGNVLTRCTYVNFDIENLSPNPIVFNGLVNCEATVASPVQFVGLTTKTDFCVNNYLDLGYFTIPLGIAYVESLDFTFNECGCTGICCSTYYFYSNINQNISYIDCSGNSTTLSIKARTATFICLSELLSYGTVVYNQLNECQCCESECYTVTATNNNPVDSITITATDTTCFGVPTTINAGESKNICVSESITLDYSGLGDPLDLDMEFIECDCST
jgi:hypothetical protein